MSWEDDEGETKLPSSSLASSSSLLTNLRLPGFGYPERRKEKRVILNRRGEPALQ